MQMHDPVRVNLAECADERWDDPARGSLRWRTLMSAALNGTSAMVCGVAEIAPGEHFALHSHAEPEVYFGLEGEGTVMIDGQPHAMAPGVALYIPGHAVHGVPECHAPMRWFYVFARDSFDQIAYSFVHEGTAAGDATPTPAAGA